MMISNVTTLTFVHHDDETAAAIRPILSSEPHVWRGGRIHMRHMARQVDKPSKLILLIPTTRMGMS